MKFEPCRKRDLAEHAYCVSALFDDKGERVICSCTCHKQAEIFADHRVQSVQRDLFAKS